MSVDKTAMTWSCLLVMFCVVLFGQAHQSVAAVSVAATTISGAQSPGPSATLFAAPPYSCLRNFYVSTNGNDANSGTASSPWQTIQAADTTARQGGDCINVMPGSYPQGTNLHYGGNLATPTGYVVYRCTSLDACRITANSGFGIRSTGSGPNYVMIDGFELAAGAPVSYGVGVGLFNSGASSSRTSHHIWVLNNIIHSFGQSGVDMDSGDYLYYLHNLAYDNAHVTCDAQGSGFTAVVAKATPGYTPTGADLDYGPYHIVIAWNVSHNNQLMSCGSASNPYDTDGNGIIIDDFANQGSSGVLFPYQTLVLGNVSYRNGGAGILVGRSSYVTVINNTAYDNELDPFNNGTFRAEIGVAGGQGNTVVGNIAYARPAATPSDPRCLGVSYARAPWNLPSPCPLQWNASLGGGSTAGITDSGNVWSNNVTFGGSPPYVNQNGNAIWSPDSLTCSASSTGNLCNVNPNLSNAFSSNFALLSSSPAIGYVQQRVGFAQPDAGACAWNLVTCVGATAVAHR